MGCDIHLYVEKRVNGCWQAAERFVKDKDYPDGVPDVPYVKTIYRDRNYNLFAILADVRNGRGFAGVVTGAGYHPICAPRGFPDDASPEIKAVSDQMGIDGHSHSWHTVADLMAYDWTQTTKLTGQINGPQFEEWDRWRRSHGEGPKEYCGSCEGPAIKHVSEKELEKSVRALVKKLESSNICGAKYTEAFQEQLGHVYAQVEWREPYYRAGRTLLSETLPILWRLGAPEDVRIVFWFDN